MTNQKWRIRKMPGGLWRLHHPCGMAQHPSYDWIVSKAWQLYDDIYRKENRGVPS